MASRWADRWPVGRRWTLASFEISAKTNSVGTAKELPIIPKRTARVDFILTSNKGLSCNSEVVWAEDEMKREIICPEENSRGPIYAF